MIIQSLQGGSKRVAADLLSWDLLSPRHILHVSLSFQTLRAVRVPSSVSLSSGLLRTTRHQLLASPPSSFDISDVSRSVSATHLSPLPSGSSGSPSPHMSPLSCCPCLLSRTGSDSLFFPSL